jgi:signal transduction histidine kinase
MQFRAKIVTFALALAAGAVLCAALTMTLARGIDRGVASVALAEEQLALYLAMETNVSDLLRLHVTSVAAPAEGTMPRLDRTRVAVARDIESIRALVDDELPFRGEAELEELERLDAIEAVLAEVDAAFATLAQDAVGPRPVGALAEPLTRIVTLLDERLAPQVDLAIADEAGEVLEVREEIAELARRSVRWTTAAALATLLAAALGVWALLSSFMRPFRALTEGAARLARGELGHRIPETGSDELGRLAHDFNVMAEGLERSDRALRAEEEALQDRVAERTAELKAANAHLADQDATRRRFLADVSHELRTPLTVMRGEAEVALRARGDADGEGARAALHGVVEQSEHMSRLVDDLLFVARREAGEAPLDIARTELGPLLRRTVADAGRLAPHARIGLIAADAVLATEVEADPSRIHQLLMVLLDNALRYSPEGGALRVEAGRTAGAVSITVQDEGIGIPEAEVAQVFDRFVRGSNALPGGTGLGLPVAKAIAEAHGGALAIESREGAGTAVTLTLPAAAEAPA